MPEVVVYLLEGRTIESKRSLVKDITDAVVKNIGAPPEAVTVSLVETPKTAKGKGGVAVRRHAGPLLGLRSFRLACRPANFLSGHDLFRSAGFRLRRSGFSRVGRSIRSFSDCVLARSVTAFLAQNARLRECARSSGTQNGCVDCVACIAQFSLLQCGKRPIIDAQ